MGEPLELECVNLATSRLSGLRYSTPTGWVGVTLKDTYEIVKKIASGGMGTIYEARHIRLGHRVAVKFLRPECANEPGMLTRFRKEANIVARLAHPHIVTIVDVDETPNGCPFFVMEFLEGESLGERFDRCGLLDAAAIGRIALQIAAALACVHSRKIIHRDLKPENVMLLRATGENDFVKVLDFGISKARGGARITASQTVLGTPAYMAPEQVRDPQDIDHRADQYALAAIIYEALSGVTPHTGANEAEIVMSLMTKEPRPLQELALGVPNEIAEVVMRALKDDPDARFRDISQFAWALDNALTRAANRPKERPSARLVIDPAPAESTADSQHARELLISAQQAFGRNRLDEAVGYAEQMVELAVYRADPKIYAVVARGMAALDCIFEARVGAPNRRLQRTGTDSNDASLSPKAKFLLSLSDGETVAEAISLSGFPRRDAMRMLAGLLRRGLLVAS
jgi:serine/threonine protein kinase